MEHGVFFSPSGHGCHRWMQSFGEPKRFSLKWLKQVPLAQVQIGALGVCYMYTQVVLLGGGILEID